MNERRHDGRGPGDLRPIKMTPGYLKHPAGSVLIEMGETRVLCTASLEEKVPGFLYGSGEGWVTGEYGMIPGGDRHAQPPGVDEAAVRPDGRSRSSD